MVYIIPNLSILHFGENFVKIKKKKNPKLQMHEKLHKNVNENIFMYFFMSFYGGQFKATNMLQLYTANPFKVAVKFFKTASSFPNFDVPNTFFPNSTGPWPHFWKVEKFLISTLRFEPVISLSRARHSTK